MSEFKLNFQKLVRPCPYELAKNNKGTVKQTTGNLVTAILNPKYCQAKKIYSGQIFYDKFTMKSSSRVS